MTKKRGMGAKRKANGKDERPGKKVKFMKNVSNEDEENQEVAAQSDHEASTAHVITKQRAIKEKLKIKIDRVRTKTRPKRNSTKVKGVAGKSKTKNQASEPTTLDNPLTASDDQTAASETEEDTNAKSASNVNNSKETAGEGDPEDHADVPTTSDCLVTDANKGEAAAGESETENDSSTSTIIESTANTVSEPLHSETFSVHAEETSMLSNEAASPDTVIDAISKHVMMEIIVGNQNQLFSESMAPAHEQQEEPLDVLLMGIEENTPIEVPTGGPENKIILYIKETGDYVELPTDATTNIENIEVVATESAPYQVMQNIENQNPSNVGNENVESLENRNWQDMITDTDDKENDFNNQDKNDPLLESLGDEVLMKVAKKVKPSKSKKTSVKTTVSFKNKRKGRHQAAKSVRTEVDTMAPMIQDAVNEEDEMMCKMCEQKIDDNLKTHNGEPLRGFEESAAILDSKLLLFDDGDGANTSTDDSRAYNKITSFSVYCRNSHLCHLGLVEKDKEIYFSGYVKPIHSDDPSPEDGVPGKKFGPINWWWLTGFDVGEQPTVGFTTDLGDYICMKPSEEYTPFMRSDMMEIYISKIVIEFLIYEPNASYEDLLAKLQTTQVPNDLLENFNEDMLLRHATFVCGQVITFDDTAKPKEQLLVTAPCIRRLIDLASIKFEVDKMSALPRHEKQIFRERQFEHKIDYREKLLRQVAEDRRENSGASELIDMLLPTHEKLLTPHIVQPWRCGVCDRCSRRSCRECRACGVRNFEACYQRRCFNREIMDENDEDARDATSFSDATGEDSFTVYRNSVRPLTLHTYEIAWGSKALHRDEKRTYYGSIYVDCQLISPGDFIDVRSVNPGVPPQIMKVAYMYEDESGHPRIHACFLWSGKYTVLGDISDRKELFFVNKCIDIDAKTIVKKVHVLERTAANLDNSMLEEQLQYPYVCHRSYDPLTGSFHDLEPHDRDCRGKYGTAYRYCWVCDRNKVVMSTNTPKPYNMIDESEVKINYGSVNFKNVDYHVGSAVYLKPKSLYFMYPMVNILGQGKSQPKEVDEKKYPELYRKDEGASTVSDVPAPFDIGYIKQIYANISENKLYVKVVKLYRPENTHKGDKLSKDADVNMLFWSDEDKEVPFSCVLGKCYIAHRYFLSNVEDWSRQGPDRFYFAQIYKDNKLDDIDRGEYGCPTELCDAPIYPAVKLRGLNIFAGCGGLSLGLQQARAAECKWAIEADQAAAATLKLNNPETAVFVGTPVEMLEKISKKDFEVDGQRLPSNGDVDLICATLPPESWRSINSVNAFKGSNITTFLVYLEYYQPQFFVLEADDVLLKRPIALKLALASFIRLGYQVAFDLVQVGNFGAPQNRLRTVIVGAARGYVLPDCPTSQHVFSKSSCHSWLVVDNKMYQRRNWTESAPYRATTVRDAILDLSALDVDKNEELMKYTTQSVSFYQRMMRQNLTGILKKTICNHVGKDLGPLVQARMQHVPILAGSDWRDLPNIECYLRDKTFTNKLIYAYNDPELGKSKSGQPRGVCSCSTGKRCDRDDVQENTLIPWHLVHSGKRHGHWAGLYGKLQWTGVFGGTTTNPEPLAKKAAVIHPSQSRVLTVRECARAQGFPDSFVFAEGHPAQSSYRQIGLSTCPLLARAIGYEIAKSAAAASSASQ